MPVGPSVSPFDEDQTLSCQINTWGKFILNTCYDREAGELVLKAELPDNSWFGIGFGATMTNTDMITWSVKNGQGEVFDAYSFSHGMP